MNFQPKQHRFVFRGVNLNRPIDLMEEGFYPRAINIRSVQDGIIETRPGWASLLTTGVDNIHSIKRLNDEIDDTFARIIGAGTNLYIGQIGVVLPADSGYSGDGFTYVTVAPPLSPRPWCYIGDFDRLRKAKTDGTNENWGIPPPIKAPIIQLGTPAATIIENFESIAGWTLGGSTVGPVISDPRINTTITAIVFDSGTTGWASVQPASTENMTIGAVVIVGAETNVIMDSFYPGATPTTIAAIAYDSGSNGPCSIQLSAPTAMGWIKKFSLLIINAEAVVVQDIVKGPDNIPSIRCTTTSSHSAGETVTGVRSFRAFFTASHSAGENISSNSVEFTVQGAGDGSQVTGRITKAVTVDASLAGGRPIDPENDEVNFDVWVGKLNFWIDASVFLDVDASVNDGTQNAYFKTLTVNDFAGTDPTDTSTTVNLARLARLEQKLKNAIQAGDFDRVRALQQRIATLRAVADEVLDIPLDTQSALGNQQWHRVRFKTKELFRIGTDFTRTLKDIKAIIIVVNATKTRSLRFDSLWIGGTFGPDVGNTGFPYRYTFRYKSSETGAASAWAPPSRSGIESHKQRVLVTPTVSSDPQVDKIEYARIGGVLGNFAIIGTGPNTAAPFNDDLLDQALFNAEIPDLNTFQPFMVVDLPHSGICNVAGTTVTFVSGDNFDISWTRNNIIIINNVAYTLYGPPISSTVLELNENAGAQTGVTFYLPAPEKAGQPLPSVWGPIGYGQTGIFVFGCGDSLNPGDIVWTVGNNPDLVRDTARLNICSPSEPLLAGCVWDVRNLVFSSEGYFEIFPNFALFQGSLQGTSQFVAQRVAGSIGLFDRRCLAIGKDGVYFLSKDGIYITQGGVAQSITDETLYRLFPHENLTGTTVNNYNPVDMDRPKSLSYYRGYVYFLYEDISGNPFILVYDTFRKAWMFDVVNPLTIEATTIYGEEGEGVTSLLLGGSATEGNGTLFQAGGQTDEREPIAAEIWTPCDDNSDVRLNKEFGDYILDAYESGSPITVVPGFDNYNTLLVAQIVNRGGIRSISPPLDLNSGAHQLSRNMGLQISWITGQDDLVQLFAWQFSYVIKPVNTILRFTDWDDLGIKEPKFFHGIRLHADTLNQARSIRIQGDNGLNGIASTNVTLGNIIHNGECIIDYSFDGIRATPFIAHLVRIAPEDGDQWRLFDDFVFQFDIDSPLVLSYISQITANDLSGFQHIKDGYIAHISTADLSLIFTDDGANSTPIIIPHSNGLFAKTYFLRPAGKFKTTGYSLTSASPFRHYKRASEFRGKAWGKNMGYQVLTPTGAEHYTEGPRI